MAVRLILIILSFALSFSYSINYVLEDAKFDLNDMCESSWRFVSKNKNNNTI